MVEFYYAAAVALIALRVDLERLAFMDEVAEHLVEDVAEVAVADGGDRVGCVSHYVIVMSHDVEVLEPCHLAVYGLEIASVCLLPVLAFVEPSVIRVGLLDVMDGCDDLVECVFGKDLADGLMALLVHSDLYSLEYLCLVSYQPLDA